MTMRKYDKDDKDDSVLRDGEKMVITMALMDAGGAPSNTKSRGVVSVEARHRARLSLSWRGHVSDAEIEAEAQRQSDMLAEAQTRKASASTSGTALDAYYDHHLHKLSVAWRK